jgi:hypothetical protein
LITLAQKALAQYSLRFANQISPLARFTKNGPSTRAAAGHVTTPTLSKTPSFTATHLPDFASNAVQFFCHRVM